MSTTHDRHQGPARRPATPGPVPQGRPARTVARGRPRSTPGCATAHQAIAERRPHGAGVRGLARRLPRTGGGGLGAGLRLRAVHGGQRPDRRDATSPARATAAARPRTRTRLYFREPPARHRPRLPARRLPPGRLDPGRAATCSPRARRRSGPSAPRATAPRAAAGLLARDRPRDRRLLRSFRMSGGRHAVPRRPVPGPLRGAPARSTRCCRRPSSSRSSSSTAR